MELAPEDKVNMSLGSWQLILFTYRKSTNFREFWRINGVDEPLLSFYQRRIIKNISGFWLKIRIRMEWRIKTHLSCVQSYFDALCGSLITNFCGWVNLSQLKEFETYSSRALFHENTNSWYKLERPNLLDVIKYHDISWCRNHDLTWNETTCHDMKWCEINNYRTRFADDLIKAKRLSAAAAKKAGLASIPPPAGKGRNPRGQVREQILSLWSVS